MPGDGEDAIRLEQKPEGTGEPDRSASAPRNRVGAVGGDSTPCMSGLRKKQCQRRWPRRVLSGLSATGNFPGCKMGYLGSGYDPKLRVRKLRFSNKYQGRAKLNSNTQEQFESR